MISSIPEGGQAALAVTTMKPTAQTATSAKTENAADKSSEKIAASKTQNDSVTISQEAQKLVSSALNPMDEAKESSNDKAKEEIAVKK